MDHNRRTQKHSTKIFRVAKRKWYTLHGSSSCFCVHLMSFAMDCGSAKGNQQLKLKNPTSTDHSVWNEEQTDSLLAVTEKEVQERKMGE